MRFLSAGAAMGFVAGFLTGASLVVVWVDLAAWLQLEYSGLIIQIANRMTGF
jgi:hypothetical protein